MIAAHTARRLSLFQKDALVAIGNFGEMGLWIGSPLVNWIAFGSMMRKTGVPSLLEHVPGRSEMARLTPFGRKVCALLEANNA